MNTRALVAFILIAVLAGVSTSGLPAVKAQPPSLGFTLYQGWVTVAGEPAEDGLEIKARIVGTAYVSGTVQTSGGRYIALKVGPVEGANGSKLEFILEDQVVATTQDTYALPNCGSDPCPSSRVFDINFSAGPVPPTPVPSLPARYSGFMSADGQTPSDSAPFTVRIGSNYEVKDGRVVGGDFSVIVDPQDMSLSGTPVEFFLYDVKASQSVAYQPGAIVRDLWLTFAGVPTPIPVSTATPEPTAEPTATPEATAVPTLAPAAVPTPVSTAVPTAVAASVSTVVPTAVSTPIPPVAPAAVPTPVSTVAPTAVPTPELVSSVPDFHEVIDNVLEADAAAQKQLLDGIQDEQEEGGLCAANPGGPASPGQLGLILSPLGLALWLRIKRYHIRTVE